MDQLPPAFARMHPRTDPSPRNRNRRVLVRNLLGYAVGWCGIPVAPRPAAPIRRAADTTSRQNRLPPPRRRSEVMVSREDIEGFLIRMDLDYEEVDEGMFLAHGDNGGAGVVVHHSDPVLVLRLKMMDLPAEPEDELTGLYRTLLELNATDIVHGAYGIEEGELILTDTLELENLDFTELQASIESLQLAASSHMGRIRELAQAGSVPQAMEG